MSLIANFNAVARGGKPLDLAAAISLFDHLADMQTITHGMPDEGCYARAHLMCAEVARLGLQPKKIWAFEKDDDNPLSAVSPRGNIMRWQYHVALALPVRLPDGKIETCVFDPSLYDGPISIQRWQTDIEAAPEKTVALAPDVPPFDGISPYKPHVKTDDFDADAAEQMQRARHLLMRMGAGPRLVFSSDLRAQAAQVSGAELAMEGESWVSLSLHRAREAGVAPERGDNWKPPGGQGGAR